MVEMLMFFLNNTILHLFFYLIDETIIVYLLPLG